MVYKARRLADYLEKVEAQFEWDRTHGNKPRRFFIERDETPPRPDTSKDEARALALGRLSRFEQAAEWTRQHLIDQEIEQVRKISPDAAASYQNDVEYWRGMDEQRLREDKMSAVHRALQRWDKQEQGRKEERKDRAAMQLGRRGWDAAPQDAAEARSAQDGGFARHAKRETALEKARQFTVQQQNQKGRSPDRG